jgi:hypothetical protein
MRWLAANMFAGPSAVAPRLQTSPTDVSVSVHELLHTAAVTTRLIGTRAIQGR